jgi:hypothetical protein
MLARTGHNSWCEEAHQFRLTESDGTGIRRYRDPTVPEVNWTPHSSNSCWGYLVSLFEDTNLAAIHAK